MGFPRKPRWNLSHLTLTDVREGHRRLLVFLKTWIFWPNCSHLPSNAIPAAKQRATTWPTVVFQCLEDNLSHCVMIFKELLTFTGWAGVGITGGWVWMGWGAGAGGAGAWGAGGGGAGGWGGTIVITGVWTMRSGVTEGKEWVVCADWRFCCGACVCAGDDAWVAFGTVDDPGLDVTAKRKERKGCFSLQT